MNIILFGPPGVGKTTLIGILKTLGQRAVDLEDFYPNRSRFQIPYHVEDTFLGAADLDPHRKYPGMKKVLLWLPQDIYEERRKQRDAKEPAKANQKHHEMETWFGTGELYDLVLDASPAPSKVAELLISYKEGRLHASNPNVIRSK